MDYNFAADRMTCRRCMVIKLQILLNVALLIVCVTLIGGGNREEAAVQHWEIAGTLAEACTCAVPCTCNFGQGPSPQHYCYSVLALQIDTGHYGDVKLDTLRLAMGDAQKGRVAYIDHRATAVQAEALKAIAKRVFGQNLLGQIESAKIMQETDDHSVRVQIAGRGGFDAEILTGRDGKSPIVVENNTTFNMPSTTKSKTKEFRYVDTHGNSIDVRSTNGNKGHFDWTDHSDFYF